MITIFTGTPGSGKSLHAVKIIFDVLVYAKRNVIANFEINRDIVQYKDSKAQLKNKKRKKTGLFFFFADDVITPKLLIQYAKKFHVARKEHQTLIVFDECSSDDLFNNRVWNTKGRSEWITFFRQHRKLGFDVIFITQSDKLIDKAMRCFIEYEVKHRKANNFKLFGKLLGLLSGGSLFFAIEYWYGIREKTNTTMFKYKRKWGDMFDTYKIFGELKAKKTTVKIT